LSIDRQLYITTMSSFSSTLYDIPTECKFFPKNYLEQLTTLNTFEEFIGLVESKCWNTDNITSFIDLNRTEDGFNRIQSIFNRKTHFSNKTLNVFATEESSQIFENTCYPEDSVCDKIYFQFWLAVRDYIEVFGTEHERPTAKVEQTGKLNRIRQKIRNFAGILSQKVNDDINHPSDAIFHSIRMFYRNLAPHAKNKTVKVQELSGRVFEGSNGVIYPIETPHIKVKCCKTGTVRTFETIASSVPKYFDDIMAGITAVIHPAHIDQEMMCVDGRAEKYGMGAYCFGLSGLPISVLFSFDIYIPHHSGGVYVKSYSSAIRSLLCVNTNSMKYLKMFYKFFKEGFQTHSLKFYFQVLDAMMQKCFTLELQRRTDVVSRDICSKMIDKTIENRTIILHGCAEESPLARTMLVNTAVFCQNENRFSPVLVGDTRKPRSSTITKLFQVPHESEFLSETFPELTLACGLCMCECD
jgi:hypothetical protein